MNINQVDCRRVFTIQPEEAVTSDGTALAESKAMFRTLGGEAEQSTPVSSTDCQVKKARPH